MSYTQQAQARKAAADRLQTAADFAELHATQRPLLSKRMGRGANAVEVRFTWPGVLTVYDPATGKVLATSEPGKPTTLAA